METEKIKVLKVLSKCVDTDKNQSTRLCKGCPGRTSVETEKIKVLKVLEVGTKQQIKTIGYIWQTENDKAFPQKVSKEY